METLDVVIPTFQERERLLVAVDSAEGQDFPINKIFVVDDGSDDETIKFLESHLENRPSVVLVKLHHTGLPGVARRVAILQSNADWIAFLDADDSWLRHKTSLQMRHAQKEAATLVCSNAWSVAETEVRKYFSEGARLKRDLNSLLAFDNPIINSSVIVRRQALEQVGFYCDSEEVRGVEDYATWLRISTVGKIVGLDDPLVNYTVSPTGLSKNSSGTRQSALVDFLGWATQNSVRRPDVRRRRVQVLAIFCWLRVRLWTGNLARLLVGRVLFEN